MSSNTKPLVKPSINKTLSNRRRNLNIAKSHKEYKVDWEATEVPLSDLNDIARKHCFAILVVGPYTFSQTENVPSMATNDMDTTELNFAKIDLDDEYNGEAFFKKYFWDHPKKVVYPEQDALFDPSDPNFERGSHTKVPWMVKAHFIGENNLLLKKILFTSYDFLYKRCSEALLAFYKKQVTQFVTDINKNNTSAELPPY